MSDRRSTITGDQIKDGTITSTDISSGVISGQSLITSVDTSNDHLLILDATDGALKKVAPTNLGIGGGGGGGSDTFVMSQAIEQTANMSTGYYYYKAGVGSYLFTNSISTSNFATTFPYWRIGRYATSGVLVVDADLTGYHLTGHKDGSDNDTITLKVWKAPAPSNGTSEAGTTTLVEMISVELDVSGNQMINKSGTLSSSNSFSAGDQWLITLNATSAYMSSDHYLQLSLKFEPS